MKTDVEHVGPWVDEATGVEYDSVEVPWCLFEALLKSCNRTKFEQPADSTLKEAFGAWVLDKVRNAIDELDFTECTGASAEMQNRNSWTVLVNRSQPDGGIWGSSGSSEWYAHPLFLGEVPVAPKAPTNTLYSAEIDSFPL